MLRQRLNASFIALFAVVYIYFSIRHPVWNFDDISFVIKFDGAEFLTGLKQIFLGLDLPNEYRTYSFSRCFQFIIFYLLGNNPLPFYMIMAITHLGSALLIYRLISRLSTPTIGLNVEAFGCALIWTFSPFSLSNTFHHFSYILFPFFLFLAYVCLIEKRLSFSINLKEVWPSSVLVFIICLSGEAILPPVITYLFIRIYQKRDAKYAGLHLLIVLATLVSHYLLLSIFNNYSGGTSRFDVRFTDFDALTKNLSYFFESVKSAFLQGFQLTAVSYEPYYPLLKSYSFAWSEVSQQFVYVSIFLLALILAPLIPFEALVDSSEYRRGFWITNTFRRTREILSSDGIGVKGLLALIIMLLSLWSLYFGMSFAGAKLYGHPFALQVRYGYVVLPATLVVVFLMWRNLSSLGGQGLMRATSWIIPCLVCVSWLAYEINVAPLNAEQDKKIISTLNDAAKNGVRVISIVQNGFYQDDFFNKYPAFGITNPFVRWGDSPFQQNWTVSEYLKHLGLRLESRPYIDWDSENVLFWGIGSQPTLVNKSQLMLIGSKSIGQEPVSFPRNDLYVERFQSSGYVTETRTELLITPIRFDNGSELIRLTKNGVDPRLVFIWSGTKSQDQVFVHLLDKNGKMISQGDYAYENATELPGRNGLTTTNRIYVWPVQRETWDRVSSVAIGIYKVASLSKPQIFRKVLNGHSDWEGHRLLIDVN